VDEATIAAAVRNALSDPALAAAAARLAKAIGDEIAADRGVAELEWLATSRSLSAQR
jgi:UDP:flavonoid glycosyltransferase YjiC (YdhE family)